MINQLFLYYVAVLPYLSCRYFVMSRCRHLTISPCRHGKLSCRTFSLFVIHQILTIPKVRPKVFSRPLCPIFTVYVHQSPLLTTIHKKPRPFQTQQDIQSVAVRVGPFWQLSGFVRSIWAKCRKKPDMNRHSCPVFGRGDRIWTCDLLVPKNEVCGRYCP